MHNRIPGYVSVASELAAPSPVRITISSQCRKDRADLSNQAINRAVFKGGNMNAKSRGMLQLFGFVVNVPILLTHIEG